MVSISRKTLFEEKLRFAISSGGVALAVMLILVLDGIFAGVNRQITAYLDNSGADLIVAQKGTRNLLGARSVVQRTQIGPVEKVDGVAHVTPVIVQYVVLDLGGRKEFSLMIGFDREKGGGPWRMVDGQTDISDRQVIFDQVVAGRHEIGLGDRVKILDRTLTVAGLSGGTSSWMTGTFFVTFDAAAELIASRGNPSYLLVRMTPGESPQSVAERIERETGLTATTKAHTEANDLKLYAGIFNGPLGLMVATAFLIGVAIVGLTIYTATAERAKQYGALKAIGIRNRRLYLIVLEQALISSAVGFGLGVGLAFGTQWLLARIAPQFLVAIDGWSIARLSAIALLMGAVSAFLPARAVARIDPAIAFRRGA